MEQKNYEQIIKDNKIKDHKTKKAFMAFFGGGIIGLLGQILITIFINLGFSLADSTNYMMITVIGLTAILTGFGIIDLLTPIFGGGMFVPITGFANAMSSAALEGKSEGLILGIGSNIFKLVGSVLTYGIVSALLLAIVKWVIQ